MNQVTKGRLEDMYIRQRLSLREIGARLGCSGESVRTQLAEHGIPTRSRGRRVTSGTVGLRLRALLDRLGMTPAELARDLNCTRQMVHHWLHDDSTPSRAYMAVIERLERDAGRTHPKETK